MQPFKNRFFTLPGVLLLIVLPNAPLYSDTDTTRIEKSGIGFDISIHGTRTVIGAAGEEPWGAAYVYFRDLNQGGWVEEAKLIPNAGGMAFGKAVDISNPHYNRRIIVGDPENEANGFSSGSAHIFERQYVGNFFVWTPEIQLFATNPEALDRFGHSVAIEDSTAVVGAIGEIYIYAQDMFGWNLVKTLESSNPLEYTGKIDLSGDYIVGGATWEENPNGDGAAVIFYRHEGGVNNWGLQALLTSSVGGVDFDFGAGVAIEGDYLVIGNEPDDLLDTTGSAFVFKRDGTTWTEEEVLSASDGTIDNYYGREVDLDGDRIIVGAWGQDNFYGAAYVYERDEVIPTQWNETGKLITEELFEKEYGWSVSADGGCRAASSLSGDVVYLICDPPSLLLISSTLEVLAPPIPQPDGTIGLKVRWRNHTPDDQRIERWAELWRPDGQIEELLPVETISVPGAQVAREKHRFRIDSGYPIGEYHLVVGWFDDREHSQSMSFVMQNSVTGFAKSAAGIPLQVRTLPKANALGRNYPNPFNPSTTIKYELSHDTHVTLKIFNILGHEVATVVDGYQPAGYKSVVWDGKDVAGKTVASGIYLYRMVAGDFIKSHKMLLHK